ncbi:hypothetical protein APLC1_0253 [Limnospira platensis C1]|nr:hypothetical protein APLC1_0253 [Arthrospira platensis C1]
MGNALWSGLTPKSSSFFQKLGGYSLLGSHLKHCPHPKSPEGERDFENVLHDIPLTLVNVTSPKLNNG